MLNKKGVINMDKNKLEDIKDMVKITWAILQKHDNRWQTNLSKIMSCSWFRV